MLIREMTEADLDEVSRIEWETFSDPWSKTSFLESISEQNNYYLVALINDIIVGYCGYCGVLDEGYIYNVAVDSSYRRRGIGYKIVEEVIIHAARRGIHGLTLEVRISNKAAIYLYKRHRFVELGIRKDFYTSPIEDAITMWKCPIQ